MKLKIYPNLIIRVPQFDLQASLAEHWQELKESIRYASDDFYSIIKDVPISGIDDLPHTVSHAIWKYFNRSVYRPIPYGSFAGIGVISPDNQGGGYITINNSQVFHKFICWTRLKDYITKIHIHDDTTLFANSSYYPIQDRLRFLVRQEDGFEISEIEASGSILEILKKCQAPIKISELKKRNDWNADKLKWIKQMIDLQLLFTDAYPNIIGQDYFARTDIFNNKIMPQYIISEREVTAGYPDKNVFKNLAELIELMQTLIKAYKGPILERFKTGFNRHYEGRHIPIMSALDPELGINITGNEEAINENPLITSWSKRKSTPVTEKENVLETLLLNACKRSVQSILDLEQLVGAFESSPGKLPNSIGVLCSIVDGQLILESMGGATATAIHGRYTIASEQIKDICMDIAASEQKANSNVLFFDIAYLSEPNADNINRRCHIYPFQLSILNFDTSAFPLTLDDIYVTVQNDEIILHSRHHNKRLIPRMSTAYNYNRSDLPLFRFLCELQFQGLKANLGFNLPELLPGQNAYPRVQFKNVILSPAKCMISLEDLSNYMNAAGDRTFISYIRELGLGRFVLTRTEDRTMCFDTESKIDLGELLYVLKKFRAFYIEEGFVPKDSIIKDQAGKPYASQVSLAVIHNQTIYEAKPFNFINEQISRRNFVPGSQWLYYDIFVHPFCSDYLLQDKLSSFLKKHRLKIKSWFFVRYNEHGDHIRLRIKLRDKNTLGVLIVDMADMLEAELDSGLISEFKINRYQRELERYDPELMDYTEQVFFQDSKYVMALLSSSFTDQVKYQICIEMLLRIRDHDVLEVSAFDQMIERTSNYFLDEHKMKHEDFKVLNREFKKFQAASKYKLTTSVAKRLADFESGFAQLLVKCDVDKRQRLFIDVLHMHVNRLFSTDQRTHEMVIYYFLLKRCQYERAMKRRSATTFGI